MVLAVIAGTETGGNWWLRKPLVMVGSPGGGDPPDGAPPSSPRWGAHSCPASAAASSSGKCIRSSRASRLARLSETLQQQEPRWAIGSHQRNSALPNSFLWAWTENDDANADAEEDADEVSGLWELEQF